MSTYVYVLACGIVSAAGLAACSSDADPRSTSTAHAGSAGASGSSGEGAAGSGAAGSGADGGGGGSGGGGSGGTASDSRPEAVFAQSNLPRDALGGDPNVLANTAHDDAAFACDLYRTLRASDGNLFFSPFSITTAMAMAWAGAKGQTADEIQSVFHFGDPEVTHPALGALELAMETESHTVTLTLANSMWVLPSMKPLDPFLDVLAKNYAAGIGLVDFDDPAVAAATIDRWVSERTFGSIDELLKPTDLPPKWTAAVLTNAAYFEGRWQEPFDPTDTTDADFQRANGTAAGVKMMRSEASRRYVKGDGFQAAALPYNALEGHHFEMIVALPDAPLSDFEPSVDAAWLDSTLAAMRSTLVDIALPRFGFSSAFKLKEALSAMGMPTAFVPGTGDFSGIAPAVPPLHLLDVIHQGFVSVNEAGTQAAAATAVIVAKDGGISLEPPVELRLDRPFLVFIRHVETGSLLFMGRIDEP